MKDFKNQLDYKNKEIIDKSNFGIIHKVLNLEDKNYYCVKRYFLKEIDIRKVENEANILKNFNHENIVKYYDSYIEKDSFYIIMEYCENSNLFEFIRQHYSKKKFIDKNVIYYIILDICSGLKEIHNKNIIHRDLKPENILISKDFKIKIGNFVLNHTITPIDTFGYMAPEQIKGEKYDNKIDIWALGCIIYELCTLNSCFECENNIKPKNTIAHSEYDKIKLKEYNSEWINLIDLLLKENKYKRPDINKVYEVLCNFRSIDFIYEEKYLNSLDKISCNILKNIKILNLKDKNIGNEGLMEIAKKEELKVLDLSDNNISDISLLEKAKFNHLKILNLSKNKISNINILERLNFKKLKELDLSYNNISDLVILGKVSFEKLEKLNISHNKLSNRDFFKELIYPNLRKIDLSLNKISDIKPLKDVLKEIDLSTNIISNIEGLQNINFKNLKVSHLNHNKILDVEVFHENINFKNLKYIDLSHNNISDIKVLNKVGFELLNLDQNQISDINALQNANFKELKKLDLSYNNISDINILGKVKFEKLEKLNLSHNKISDINTLQNMIWKELKELDLSYNNISDIKVLEKVKLEKIEKLELSNNIIPDINILKNISFKELKELVLINNNIIDIEVLEKLELKMLPKLNINKLINELKENIEITPDKINYKKYFQFQI